MLCLNSLSLLKGCLVKKTSIRTNCWWPSSRWWKCQNKMTSQVISLLCALSSYIDCMVEEQFDVNVSNFSFVWWCKARSGSQKAEERAGVELSDSLLPLKQAATNGYKNTTGKEAAPSLSYFNQRHFIKTSGNCLVMKNILPLHFNLLLRHYLRCRTLMLVFRFYPEIIGLLYLHLVIVFSPSCSSQTSFVEYRPQVMSTPHFYYVKCLSSL